MGIPRTIARVELERHNLMELLTYSTMKQISERFNCSVSLVSTVAESQFSKLEINRFENSKEKIEFTGTKGAWLAVKETTLYKQIFYGREENGLEKI